MADPTIQTFCCHHRNNSDFAVKLMSEFNKDSYVTTCLISSGLGILGALYQIFFRHESESRRGSSMSANSIGRHIIVSLAIADLFATLGVFVRSLVWRYMRNFIPMDNDTYTVTFCAISSAWTQFFYTATFFYTMFYAISIHQILKGVLPYLRRYHLIVWSASAALTAIGVTILYVPNADCHDTHQLSTAILRVLPIYLVTYIPVVCVMIGNPLLFIRSSKLFENQLGIENSQITQEERLLMRRFKVKFSFINAIFYICWMPNLVSSFILWFCWDMIPVRTILTTWTLMAILNPLQALFNAFVYRKWTRVAVFDTCVEAWRRKRRRKRSGESKITKNIEKSPLLKDEPTDYESTTITGSVDSIIEAPNTNNGHSVNSCSCV
ncbi:G-protein coupled receptor 143-like [Culicoides brevitarsis]|uniref:G-protein coupled receptor 143-like n=1 Tax=Culicoides brevitarsis TaxID=469753 RepID=UPI00307BBEA3